MASVATTWRSRAWLSHAVFLIVAGAYAIHFGFLRMAKPEWGPSALETVMAGEGNTPFQYRILVPWAIQWASVHWLPLPFIGTPRGLAFLVEMLSVFLLLVTFRAYLGCFFKGELARTLLAFTLIFVLPFNYLLPRVHPWWLVYDLPSLLFFTLGLLLLYRRNWLLYYPLFAIATLNRETTCFLTLIYAITALGKDKWLKLFAHGAAQFCIWVAIKAALYRAYAGNPGGEMGVYYATSNLRALLQNPPYVPLLMSSIGFVWLPVLVYYPLVREPFVRRACLVGPAFFLGMLLKANLPEIRIYGEMIPVFLPAFLLLLQTALSMSANGEPLAAAGSDDPGCRKGSSPAEPVRTA